MRQLYRRRLGEAFEVVTAAWSESAVGALTSFGDWAGIVLELELHDDGGPRIHDWICRHRPALAERIVFTTISVGPATMELARVALESGRLYRKPTELAVLFETVLRWR
jgi:hypothetical protein